MSFDIIDPTIDEQSLEAELVSLFAYKPTGKILFYRYNKKWYGLIYSLHKGDRLILLKMILDICSYNEQASKIINIHDSQSSIDFLFFLLAMILQQKRIDRLNVGDTKKNRDVTLLDFMLE